MLYSCTHMAAVGASGLEYFDTPHLLVSWVRFMFGVFLLLEAQYQCGVALFKLGMSRQDCLQ